MFCVGKWTASTGIHFDKIDLYKIIVLKHLIILLSSLLVLIHFNVSGQIGIDTVHYQWSGQVKSVGRVYYETYIYSFYPNGTFSYLSLNSKHNNDSGNL